MERGRENSMGILAVGSVAFDTIKTPFGQREEVLGGSATYFSLAASYFTRVALLAVVGRDFPAEYLQLFREKDLDVSGLQVANGSTFRWKGEYGFDLNTANTLDTQLNVFADFDPVVTAQHRGMEFLFLGNIDPDLQRSVLKQMDRPRLVICDTMNFWIEKKRESLMQTLAGIDILVINDAETRQLAGESNVIRAGRKILGWGPRTLVVKRGEYGALMLDGNSVFSSPAFPVEEVVDPTGAGDSFAGGFVGYLAATGDRDPSALRRAIIFGSVMASFNVGEFGPERLQALTFTEIENRFREFRQLTHFEDL